MARVQKRKLASGKIVWLVKWYTPDGRDRTKSGFATRKEAKDYGTKAEGSKLRGVEFDPRAGGVTFREVAAKWLDSRPNLKETTRAAYRDALAPNNGSKRHKRLEELRIDAVFGGWPLNRITREHVQDWVNRMVLAGKAPSTVRNAYFIVHQVLRQAYVDGLIAMNPAQRGYINLPTNHSSGRNATVDDPAMFLAPNQIDALVAATPWPCNVLVYVAAWTGLRAAEIAGLQIGDVTLPAKSANPNAPARSGTLRVERTAQRIDGEMRYVMPKTKGSRRTVPLTEATSAILRDYLALHPRRNEPAAPLFPAVSLVPQKPTGVKNPAGVSLAQQASALAGLSVEAAEARLDIDWSKPLRHSTFYKAVYRPAILRANRLYPTAAISPELKFHSLRHTYASLCVAGGLDYVEVSRFMGHASPSITLGVYTHLFNTDDHSEAMRKLGAMAVRPAVGMDNVIPFAR